MKALFTAVTCLWIVVVLMFAITMVVPSMAGATALITGLAMLATVLVILIGILDLIWN